MTHIGETAAFATAICWTITGTCFEIAGKKVGSFAVNLIRLLIAFLIMSVYNYFTRGMLLPLDANYHSWLWLVISGLIGFVLGDLFLFQAYVLIGSRISLLIMSLAPPITAVFGYFILGEKLGLIALLGILLVVLGICMVVFTKNESDSNSKIGLSKSIKGLLYALLGAIGQAIGLISSKIGMRDYSNPFAATQIRIIAGIIGFLVLYAISKRWNEAYIAVKNKKAMLYITIGSIMGPFLGVSLSLYAVNNTETAIASAIMSIMPILIIPISVTVFKEKVNLKEILGALVTVSGVIILFL
jgi:drug/metabolite transporter (DMT)-like permease